MKKIVTTILGIAVVIGAGVGLWIALDANPAAATVGNTKITVSQLNKGVNEIIAERKTVSTTGMQLAFGSALQAQELNFYIISTLLEKAAAENGVVVTPAQVTTRAASIMQQEGSAAKLKTGEVSAGIAATEFPGYVKEILTVEGLTNVVKQKGVTEANSGTAVQGIVRDLAKRIGVKINPKYGTWDSNGVSVTPPTGTK